MVWHDWVGVSPHSLTHGMHACCPGITSLSSIVCWQSLAKVLQHALDNTPATPVAGNAKALDHELKTFLRTNTHYDIGRALILLSSCGLPEHLLVVRTQQNGFLSMPSLCPCVSHRSTSE